MRNKMAQRIFAYITEALSATGSMMVRFISVYVMQGDRFHAAEAACFRQAETHVTKSLYRPVIIIGSLLLWMASCHPADNIEPPVEEPMVEEPVEEGTPLLLEPNEAVTITVADETFTVDFSVSEKHMQWMFLPQYDLNFLQKTREGYVAAYKEYTGFPSNATDAAHYRMAMLMRLEHALAQECFSDQCTPEIRKEVMQKVVDIQKRKYDRSRYVELTYAIHSGVFLMAVIMVKERAYSAQCIDSETLQKALLFLDDFDYITEESLMYYGRDFSNLIVECAQNFLTEFNK